MKTRFVTPRILILTFFLLSLSCATVKKTSLYTNYVPNESIAVRVGEVILSSVYGERVANYKPYTAKIKVDNQGDSLWCVEGHVYTELGGAPTIYLRKNDCKVKEVKWPK